MRQIMDVRNASAWDEMIHREVKGNEKWQAKWGSALDQVPPQPHVRPIPDGPWRAQSTGQLRPSSVASLSRPGTAYSSKSQAFPRTAHQGGASPRWQDPCWIPPPQELPPMPRWAHTLAPPSALATLTLAPPSPSLMKRILPQASDPARERSQTARGAPRP
jgi:hypothetical protein